MKLGARKHLEQDDLWDVAPRHRAAHLSEQYSAAMRKTARPERFPHVRIYVLCRLVFLFMASSLALLELSRPPIGEPPQLGDLVWFNLGGLQALQLPC